MKNVVLFAIDSMLAVSLAIYTFLHLPRVHSSRLWRLGQVADEFQQRTALGLAAPGEGQAASIVNDSHG